MFHVQKSPALSRICLRDIPVFTRFAQLPLHRDEAVQRRLSSTSRRNEQGQAPLADDGPPNSYRSFPGSRREDIRKSALQAREGRPIEKGKKLPVPMSALQSIAPHVFHVQSDERTGALLLAATLRPMTGGRPPHWLEAEPEYPDFVIPRIWLRDHCDCHQCVRQDTKQRLVNVLDANVSSEMKACEVKNDSVSVTWGDSHKSQYSFAFLRRAWVGAHTMADRQGEVDLVQWTAKNVQDSSTEVAYDDVMRPDGSGLAEWTKKIRQFGFCFVEGCPPTPEATQALLERIGPIRNTHYGAFYDFTSNMASKDTAYTSEGLDVHTDTTYFSDPAGLQLFHLLSHEGTGGESQLVDGFEAAKILHESSPNDYRALSEQPMYFHSSGNDGLSIQPHTTAPVLQHHGYANTLSQVRWNNADRASFFLNAKTKSEALIAAWYKAARRLNNILQADLPSVRQEFLLKPGRPLIFDNWRVLHGRSAFTGARRMCGGYVNRDDFISRYRTSNFGHDEVLKSGVY